MIKFMNQYSNLHENHSLNSKMKLFNQERLKKFYIILDKLKIINSKLFANMLEKIQNIKNR